MASEDGGAIRSYHGTMMISDSTLTGNRTATDPGWGQGGAISNSGYAPLTLTRSALSGNFAAGSGGAIDHDSRELMTVTDSEISGNTSGRNGGGIYGVPGWRGSITVINSTLSGNTAVEEGGALFHYGNRYYPSYHQLIFENSILTRNTADQGGAIQISNAHLNLTNIQILSNQSNSTGGGISIDHDSRVKLEASTLTGNTATDQGGAIYGRGEATVLLEADNSFSENSPDDLCGSATFEGSGYPGSLNLCP